MNITLVNRSDTTGGASIACQRLLMALRNNDVSAKLLVQDKKIDAPYISQTQTYFYDKYLDFVRFAFERLLFTFFERTKEVRFAFSIANTGKDVSKKTLIKKANIIHLHWINFGFLSINNLRQLFSSGKPVVWTLHDMWAFTGGCHYSGNCKNYEYSCKNCPFLKNPSGNDLSSKIFKKKRKLFYDKDITFVTCSQWLKSVAEKSALLKEFRIEHIPNPINTSFFRPLEKSKIRVKYNLAPDKYILLFGAYNIHDTRKGFIHLINALYKLSEKDSNLTNKIEIVLFGKTKSQSIPDFPFKINPLQGLPITSMPEVYNLADVFILPSLEDNLPNTIMESLSCGTPVVAFNTGGIPEMIDHNENGYLAKFKSSEDLAKGIYELLFEKNHQSFAQKARDKVLKQYSENIIAEQYKKLYNSLI